VFFLSASLIFQHSTLDFYTFLFLLRRKKTIFHFLFFFGGVGGGICHGTKRATDNEMKNPRVKKRKDKQIRKEKKKSCIINFTSSNKSKSRVWRVADWRGRGDPSNVNRRKPGHV